MDYYAFKTCINYCRLYSSKVFSNQAGLYAEIYVEIRVQLDVLNSE